jgi:protoheme IX farnesyltransferase
MDGLDRLASQRVARRLKVGFETDAARNLYLGAGFVQTSDDRGDEDHRSAAHSTINSPVISRLPYSMYECNPSGPTSWCLKHVGQSGQPNPDPDSRTAAPESTMSTRATRSARANQRNCAGVTRSRDVESTPLAYGSRRRRMAAVAMTLTENRTARATVGAYVALTKPRIIELLLVTTVPTMVVAANGIPGAWLIVVTLIGGTFAAGGANAFNMVIDRDIDALMERTKNRPLVTGAMTPRAATIFAGALEVAAFVLLASFVNFLSAFLAVAATAFYVFVYTIWLKRRSAQNIVIGGAAGAVPVLIGWSAVTNSLSWTPVLLFAVIFIWTPPHFWALAVRYRDDYEAAHVPMLPVVASLRRTTLEILVYTVVLWAVSLLVGPVAGLGWIYAVSALVLGGLFTFFAARLHLLARQDRADVARAMRLFHFSITYLTALFVLMALDVIVRHH